MTFLIRSELKKIFKNKFNWFLLVVLIGISITLPLQRLHNEWVHIPSGFADQQSTLETFEGNPLKSSKEFYQYADQILSKYEGKPTQETWETFINDYNTYFEKFTSEFDEEKMKEAYGQDWKSLWENNENHTLSEAQRQKLLKLYHEESNTVSHYDEESDTFLMTPYYTQDIRLVVLNLIYGQMINTARLLDPKNPSISDDLLENYPYYIQLHPEQYINASEEGIIGTDFDQTDTKNNFSQYIKENFVKMDHTVYTGISMTILKNVVSSSTIFTLIILAILCANTFAQEKSTKMNQIISCTPTGTMRIALAKVIANLCICIGITLLLAGLYFVISCIYMVPEGWSGLAAFLSLYTTDPIYVTYAQYFLTWLQVWIAGAVMVCGIVSLLSCITKNQFVTMLGMFVILLAPPALQGALPRWFLSINPFVFYNADTMLISNYHIPDPMIAPGIWLKHLVMVLWILVLFLFTVIILWKEKSHKV